ncbi:LADA_0E10792g1_1 [Lachancea dasiensis]|uniref:LADA_0E10792g1_1 n=1 Tax=Lachancea dasiensis TaxID=1072105 RepID=A0A1G4JEA6_9SACH|nr:LADA_0E10792g1_1 [Lachancea dasiensis]
MSSNQQLLVVYKQLIRSLVKSNKRSKIAQITEDNKKQVALLTYRKFNLLRQQASDQASSNSSKHNGHLSELTNEIERLKANDPARSKALHYYENSSSLREMIFQNFPGDAGSVNKRLQHLKDISGFVKNQMEYEELVERYNPGLKMDQEEKVKRTAARVGLQVPDL